MSEAIKDGGPVIGEGVSNFTLRDYFASAALNQRKMIATGAWYAADAAREAYEIADAMLKAREVPRD